MKIPITAEEKAAKEAFDLEVGEYLKDARIQANLSQGKVAEAAELSSPQFISNIERGSCAVPPYLLRVMIKQYGIPLNAFLDFLADAKMAYYKKVLSLPNKKSNSSRRG